MKGKTLLFGLLVVICLLSGISGVTWAALFSDDETSDDNVMRVAADWYSFDWQWRKPITLTNESGGLQSDYQIKLTVNTQELISAG